MYRYFLDNQKTQDRRSVIFGLRELNSTETTHFCFNQSANASLPPIADTPCHFTSNYELRVYTSGCYYFDERVSQWKSDGVLVSEPFIFRFHVLICFIGGQGGRGHESLRKRMPVHAPDHVRRWISRFANANQLELCVRTCRLQSKQDHLHKCDLSVADLSTVDGVRAIQGPERYRKGNGVEVFDAPTQSSCLSARRHGVT